MIQYVDSWYIHLSKETLGCVTEFQLQYYVSQWLFLSVVLNPKTPISPQKKRSLADNITIYVLGILGTSFKCSLFKRKKNQDRNCSSSKFLGLPTATLMPPPHTKHDFTRISYRQKLNFWYTPDRLHAVWPVQLHRATCLGPHACFNSLPSPSWKS